MTPIYMDCKYLQLTSRDGRTSSVFCVKFYSSQGVLRFPVHDVSICQASTRRDNDCTMLIVMQAVNRLISSLFFTSVRQTLFLSHI
jgi:hypothetical protein